MHVSSRSAPLALLTKLSSRVYFMPGPTGEVASVASEAAPAASAATPLADPKLILLATWMGAQDAHIAKYIDPYRKQYPSSPILLLRSESKDFLLWRSRAALDPALTVLRQTFASVAGAAEEAAAPDAAAAGDEAAAASTPELLVHVWSNGGSASLNALRSRLPPAAFPAHTLLFDSAPGQFHYSAAYTAFSLTLPAWARALSAPLLHAVCVWFWLFSVLPGAGQTLAALAASHNARALRPREVGRAYVYSGEDALIPAADVEAHAAQAAARGFDTRLERFRGSAHVAHARHDPERYWRIVRETWARRGERAAQ